MNCRSTFTIVLITAVLGIVLQPRLARADPSSPGMVQGAVATAILKSAFMLKGLLAGGVSNTGDQILIGTADLGARTNQTFLRGETCDGTLGAIGAWAASNHVKYEYDAVSGIFKVAVNASRTYCPQYILNDIGRLDYLQIDLVKRTAGATVQFNNVMLNGKPLGNFTVNGQSSWYMSGLDLASGFSLEGDLLLAGPGGGDEDNALKISVGAAASLAGVRFSTDNTQFCAGDGTTVDIMLDNVVNLAGYKLQVHYDSSIVAVTAASLDQSWFNPSGNAAVPAGWNAQIDATAATVRFGSTQPAGTTANGAGRVASLTLKGLHAGRFTVSFDLDSLLDNQGLVIPHSLGTLSLTVCGTATVTGKVSLQGRATPMDAGTVTLSDGALAVFWAPFDPVTGVYTVTNIRVKSDGTPYFLIAGHSLYLSNMMTRTLMPGEVFTAADTRLLGGNVKNIGHIGVGELACIGADFGAAPSTCNGTGGSDINHDGIVNIQDLAIAGGNFDLPTGLPW